MERTDRLSGRAVGGASEAELQSKMSVQPCWGLRGYVAPERVCEVVLTVGIIPVNAYVQFRASKMVAYHYVFATEYFPMMLLALKERYGMPTEEFGGAQIGLDSSDQVFQWVGERTTVALHKHFDKPGRSAASFETKEESDEQLGRMKRLKGKAAESLD